MDYKKAKQMEQNSVRFTDTERLVVVTKAERSRQGRGGGGKPLNLCDVHLIKKIKIKIK